MEHRPYFCNINIYSYESPHPKNNLGRLAGTEVPNREEYLPRRDDVAVFSSNYNLYDDMSRRVMSLLSQYSPKVDVYSIDEAFLDLSEMGTSEELIGYCKKMVRFIHKGTGIPISLGIAPTKTLAKMASKFAKKHKGYEGVCLIDTDEKREKALKLFSVEDVWGICRDNAILGNLFDTVNREKQAALAKAIDAINRKNGHNKIRVAVQGWQLKREYISKQYTTNLEDVIVLKTY